MKTIKAFLFLTALLVAFGISAPVYSGGNSEPELAPFKQDSVEIDWDPVYNYYTGESHEDYRQLRVMVPGTFGPVDSGEFIQLVSARYAKNRNANDRNIVEIEYVYFLVSDIILSCCCNVNLVPPISV